MLEDEFDREGGLDTPFAPGLLPSVSVGRRAAGCCIAGVAGCDAVGFAPFGAGIFGSEGVRPAGVPGAEEFGVPFGVAPGS